MSYPEKGAGYRSNGSSVLRMAGAHKAQGGPVSIGNREVGRNGPSVSETAEAATQDAGDDLSYAMNRKRPDQFHDSGLRIPGKLKAQNDRVGRAEGGSVEERYMAPSNMKPTDPSITAEDVKTWGTPGNARAAARAREHAKPLTADDEARMGREMAGPSGRKRGGAVKRRADGGAMLATRVEPLVDQRGRTSSDVNADERPARLTRPSSPEAAQDARDQAAKRTRNTRATPNSYPVGGRAGGGSVDLPPPVRMPTVQRPDTGDRIEGAGSESNKPSIMRGKKPL